MITRATYTTRKLERYATNLGINFNVVMAEDNTHRYFITGIDGQPFSSWIGLGWSRREAEAGIDDLIEQHEEERQEVNFQPY